VSDEVLMPEGHYNPTSDPGFVVRACDVAGCIEHGSVRARVKFAHMRAPEPAHLCARHFRELAALGVAVDADTRPPTPLEARERLAVLTLLRGLGGVRGGRPVTGGVLRLRLGRDVRDVAQTLKALVEAGQVLAINLDECSYPRYTLA
jgi:hypothetical protein